MHWCYTFSVKCEVYLWLIFTGQWHLYNAEVIVKKLVLNESAEKFDDEEALFGPDIPKENPVVGYLYTAVPLNGCAYSIPLPENASRRAIPFISLIKRGNCNFDAKVRAAERGGYVAAIIFNHINDGIFPMGSQSTIPVTIPSVMVGRTDGTAFMNKFTNPYENYVFEIHPNHRSTPLVYIIPVLTILVLFLLGLICVCACRWNEQRRRRLRRCLTSAEVQCLPTLMFIKGQNDRDACAICLEDYENGDTLRSLPCGHAYHTKCIDPWLLKSSRTCPICKRRVARQTRFSRSILRRIRSSCNGAPTDDSENRLIISSEEDEDDDIRSEDANRDTHYPSTSYGTITPTTQHSTQYHPVMDLTESTPLLADSAVHNDRRTVGHTVGSGPQVAHNQIFSIIENPPASAIQVSQAKSPLLPRSLSPSPLSASVRLPILPSASRSAPNISHNLSPSSPNANEDTYHISMAVPQNQNPTV